VLIQARKALLALTEVVHRTGRGELDLGVNEDQDCLAYQAERNTLGTIRGMLMITTGSSLKSGTLDSSLLIKSE
jgi:hypothetical protein